MAKRRANQEGTIYKRENGSWRAQLSVDGQRLSFTGKSQRECQEWVKQTLRKVDKGHVFARSTKTLDEFLSEWLVSIKSSRRASTWNQYKRIIRVHILPELGEVLLRDLRPEHLQSHYDTSLEKGVGRRTVQITHSVLHCALKQAVKLKLLNQNPAEAASAPKRVHKEMDFYDETQVQKLIHTAQSIEDRNLALYQLAITTGMRQAELLGMKWEDIDWERRMLTLKRQLTRKVGGGFDFTSPKTKAGKRAITLGEQTLARLSEHQQRQMVDIQLAGELWNELGLAFPSTIGTPMDAVTLRKAFKQLIKEAGLPEIRFHDLRHTAASLMLNHGIPVIVASRRLGHSKPSITLDIYGHLIPAMQEEAAGLMDSILSPEGELVAPELHREKRGGERAGYSSPVVGMDVP